MSYIRPLSSPEGLYVFGSFGGVEWHQGGSCLFTMPSETFSLMCRTYVEDEEECVLPEVSVTFEQVDGKFKIVLRYLDHPPVVMWDVTWEHIISRYRDEVKVKARRRLFRR